MSLLFETSIYLLKLFKSENVALTVLNKSVIKQINYANNDVNVNTLKVFLAHIGAKEN